MGKDLGSVQYRGQISMVRDLRFYLRTRETWYDQDRRGHQTYFISSMAAHQSKSQYGVGGRWWAVVGLAIQPQSAWRLSGRRADWLAQRLTALGQMAGKMAQ